MSNDLNVRIIAEKLGKDLEDAADSVTLELQEAIKNIADSAYAGIIAQIQASSMGDQNKKDYLNSLNFQNLGNDSYLIYLDGSWPNMMEEGSGPFSIKDNLLKSDKKVGIGPRAGEPWVRENAEGKKYAAVPFEKRKNGPGSGDLANDIKKLFAFNRQGKTQNITKIFTDDLGKPISGKVAVASSGSNPNIPANLEGLVKYQSISPKGRVSSAFVVYRIVSEDSTGWIHPGMPGYNFFDKVEKDVEAEIENILNTLF